MNNDALLRNSLGSSGWKFKKPEIGASKETWIAIKGQKKVFIKLDVDVLYLKRLSELDISPSVIARGQQDGKKFVVQEFIEGIHPDVSWFSDCLSEIGAVINKYHSDELLSSELRNNGRLSTYNDQINDLSNRIDQILDNKIKKTYLTILERLKRKSELIQTEVVTPIHADPNISNFLVNGDKIKIIDWDDILLSDPLRDVGLICFWYLPKEKWVEFINVVKIDQTSNCFERIYWWTSAQSLAISLWFMERKNLKNTQLYLEDAQSAIEKGPNPHAGF